MNRKNAYELFAEGKKLLGQNENMSAIMLFEQAAELEPQKASIRENLAVLYYNCGLYKSAKKHFLIMAQIDASNDFAYFGLGMCLAKEGKLAHALGQFKIARAMKPEDEHYIKIIKKYSQIFDKFHKMQRR